MARGNSSYLTEKAVESIFTNPTRQAKVIRYFAEGKFVGNFEFEFLGKENILVSMAILDIYEILEHMFQLPIKYLCDKYGDKIANSTISTSNKPPLLLYFEVVCELISMRYNEETDAFLHAIETDLARLVGVFFHSLGINPFESKLDWILYDYSDSWLKEYLNKQKIGSLKA